MKLVVVPFKQLRETNAAVVAILRADDLHANGQGNPLRLHKTNWCHSSRQVYVTRKTRPEQRCGGGLWLAVDVEHALPALALMVVLKRCCCRGRAQQQIGVGKIGLPL